MVISPSAPAENQCADLPAVDAPSRLTSVPNSSSSQFPSSWVQLPESLSKQLELLLTDCNTRASDSQRTDENNTAVSNSSGFSSSSSAPVVADANKEARGNGVESESGEVSEFCELSDAQLGLPFASVGRAIERTFSARVQVVRQQVKALFFLLFF